MLNKREYHWLTRLGCYRTQHFSVVVVHTRTLPFSAPALQLHPHSDTENVLFKCLLNPKNIKKGDGGFKSLQKEIGGIQILVEIFQKNFLIAFLGVLSYILDEKNQEKISNFFHLDVRKLCGCGHFCVSAHCCGVVTA